MDAYTNDVNSIIQARVKNLCSTIMTLYKNELDAYYTYVKNDDFENAHDCMVRAIVYQEMIASLESLAMTDLIR